MEDRKEVASKVAQLIETLPPMPNHISRLMAVDLDSCQQYDEVVRLIEGDPCLCTDLLRIANDFCYDSDGGEAIETIDDAVRRVGVIPLAQLITALYARKTIRNEFADMEYLNEYFAHSQDISLSGRILAELLNMPRHQRQMYAVLGLIHDVGRLVMMVAADKTSVRMMGTSWDKMSTVVHDEKEILGLNHCDVGMQLCSKWNFSPVLQEGVLRHHTPLMKDDFSFPGALIFISHFVSFSDMTGEILAQRLGPELLNRLKLTIADFEKAHKEFQLRAAQT